MQNKVIVITGASSGIGMACAREFARHGSIVVLAARNESAIRDLEKELVSEGLSAFAVKTDVSVESECNELIRAIIEKYGRIDVLINNAGISMRALFSEVDLTVLKRLMDVNFWGAVYCTKYALPWLLKSKGTVSGISSIAGFQGLPGRTGYSASKFAMHGFLEALRIENLNGGLNVLIVAPGFTASNIRKTALDATGTSQGESPMAEDKIMTSGEVASHIYKAVKNRRSTLLLTAQGKLTVLFKKFIPRLLDRMVYNHFAKEPDSPLKNN